MNPRHISVFFHEEKSYNCPDCQGPIERAHIHGWFWWCEKCKKEWPLYVLEEKGIAVKAEAEKVEEKLLGKIMNKVKGVFGA